MHIKSCKASLESPHRALKNWIEFRKFTERQRKNYHIKMVSLTLQSSLYWRKWYKKHNLICIWFFRSRIFWDSDNRQILILCLMEPIIEKWLKSRRMTEKRKNIYCIWTVKLCQERFVKYLWCLTVPKRLDYDSLNTDLLEWDLNYVIFVQIDFVAIKMSL